MFLHYNKIIDHEWIAINHPDDAKNIFAEVDEWIWENSYRCGDVRYPLIQSTGIPVLVEYGIARSDVYFVFQRSGDL